MSIEKTTVQHRKFVVKAGMTAEDVKKSKGATALQKKYANVFDSDGQKGFSQKEADLFNATTFSEKADGSVMFWTRQKDGTKKGTKMTGDIKDMHYAPNVNCKPYRIVAKDNNIWQGMTIKVAYKKGGQTLSAFNKADIDGNGTISLNELNRYEGPIYTLERYKDSGEINGTFEGKTSGAGVAMGTNGVAVVATNNETDGTVSGKIQTKEKQEFYAGVKIEDVKAWARGVFQVFDVAPRDGVLSKNEVQRIKSLEPRRIELNDKWWQLTLDMYSNRSETIISRLFGKDTTQKQKEFEKIKQEVYKLKPELKKIEEDMTKLEKELKKLEK